MCLTVCIYLSGGCSNVFEWPTQFVHKLNPTTTVQPFHPIIAELSEEFDEKFTNRKVVLTKQGVSEDEFAKAEFNALERFVYDHIPYFKEIDHPVHPCFEHYPTLEQALTQGDDCDGRAFVACSLLLYRGYLSFVVLNDNHAWVVAYLPSGEAFDILRGGSMNQWFVRWNNSSLTFNFSHPWVLLVILALFLLILKQFPRKKIFFARHKASLTQQGSYENESVHL